MRSPRAVRKEHKKVCQAMKDLLKKGGRRNRTPLPNDEYIYGRLATVKKTLEWVHPVLIETTAKGADRFNELMGHKHYVNGPTHAVLYP
jgi:ribosomal protein S19E (S16A)